MNRRSLVLSVAVLSAGTIVLFQNCSAQHFGSSGADLESMALSTPLAVGESQIKISAQQVPNLKLFFVVDNSNTMKANQVNLGQSFAQMFSDAQSNSLKRFDTTAFLISTAQRSAPLGSPELKALAASQLQGAALSMLNLSDLGRYRGASVNSGALPGDTVGFSATVAANGLSASFKPAVVLGADGAGGVGIGIHKSMGEDSSDLAGEFQKRLALLDINRQPANSDGSFVYENIISNESGLCATARLLRNSDGFVKSGEQAAFVIVSDEDENDPAGTSCVQSFNTIQPTDMLIKGTCETRSTTLTYSVAGRGADACKANFQTGYNVSYVYPAPSYTTTITYRQRTSPGGYSSPQTLVSYSTKKTAYVQTVTDISYFIKTCTPIMSDGVVRGQNCTYPQKSVRVNGNQVQNCAAAASRADAGAVTNDPAHAPSCSSSTVAVDSCAAGDSTCATNVSYASASQTVDGTFAPGDACVNRAKSIGGAITDGSKPVSCAPAAAKTGSGACPASLVALGCASTSDPTYANNTVTVSGDYSGSNCQAKAAQQPNAAVDASNVATCVKNTGTANKKFTANISFASANDGGVTIAAGACGALQSAVVAAAKAADGAAPDNGTCAITGYSTGSAVASASNGACDANSVAQVCSSSNSGKRGCTGVFVAGTPTNTPTTLPPVSRDIACSDLCSASDNVFCSPAGSVQPTAGMTIAQYLEARYGAGTTCATAQTKQTMSSFVDRPVAELKTVCQGSAATPLYAVASDPYRTSAKVVADYVAGSNPDGSVPSLAEFITTRSRALFEVTQPLVSVLVRKPGEPLGNGGSTGKVYSQVATAMGGRTDSVLSSDYSSSLQALSGVIQSRLERSFVIADMKPSQTVREVMLLPANTGVWITLSASDWSAVGNNVTISTTVQYSPDDHLRIRYF